MPEGDTIHRWADRLRDAIGGHAVRRFELRRDPHGLRPPAPGAVVTDVEARGKHLLVRFDDGATLHTHMQMLGVWHVYRPGERWRRAQHRARVVLEVDDGTTAVCFDAPIVELRRDRVTRAPSNADRSLARLGPDLCVEAADFDEALRRLATLPAETLLGDALLDQRVAAGVGNVFKSEVCWAHRRHPSTPIALLDDASRRAVYQTAHAQLRANANKPGRRVTYQGGLAVYGKHGRPCPRCRTTIRRAWTGRDDRVTYWCPTCQPPPAGVGPD